MKKENSMREFLPAERCDRCSARALHSATKGGSLELLFCNHHYQEHKDALLASYWTVESDHSPAKPVKAAAYTE